MSLWGGSELEGRTAVRKEELLPLFHQTVTLAFSKWRADAGGASLLEGEWLGQASFRPQALGVSDPTGVLFILPARNVTVREPHPY